MALHVRGQDGAAVSVVCPISMIFACAGATSPSRASVARAAVSIGFTGKLNTVRRRTERSVHSGVDVAAIETNGLERSFKGGILAVRGIDIAVAPGEVYGFLGPNGAGKSTTVRMLVTLLRPTGGSARVAGHDVAAEPDAVRRKIGVALQDAALDGLMTGRELMELQATLHGIAVEDVKDRAQELLRRVGLVEAQERRVQTYSGGMRRRLDLAMALIHEPEVLFLDEPT